MLYGEASQFWHHFSFFFPQDETRSSGPKLFQGKKKLWFILHIPRSNYQVTNDFFPRGQNLFYPPIHKFDMRNQQEYFLEDVVQCLIGAFVILTFLFFAWSFLTREAWFFESQKRSCNNSEDGRRKMGSKVLENSHARKVMQHLHWPKLTRTFHRAIALGNGLTIKSVNWLTNLMNVNEACYKIS